MKSPSKSKLSFGEVSQVNIMSAVGSSTQQDQIIEQPNLTSIAVIQDKNNNST